MAIPQACQPIDNKIQQLRRQLNDLNTPIDDPVPGGPKRPPKDPETEEEKKRLRNEIRVLTAQFNQCVQQNLPPFPVTVTVHSVTCHDQDDVGLFEDDEPYVLVYALNIPNSVKNPSIPDARVFKAGPFRGTDSGETVFSGLRVWDTNGNPAIVTKPDDVILLAALIEEDDTGADLVRTVLQTAMVVVLGTNLPALGDRPAFIQRMSEGMRGALKGAFKATVPPFSHDDLVGPVQQVSLTSDILRKVGLGTPHPIFLSFVSNSASYTVELKVRRG